MDRGHSDRSLRRRVGELAWEIKPGVVDDLLPILEELGRPLGSLGRKVPKEELPGATIFTIKTNRPGIAGELFVKVYWRRGIRKYLGGVWESAAAREWKMAGEHARRGLPIADHLARGVRRKGPAITEEYLIQESLTAYESFDEFFHSAFRPELPGALPQDKRKVIHDLSTLIRAMHDRGISRPGIEPRNIMATSRAGGGVKLVFVDLPRSFLRRSGQGFAKEERVLELARFHESFSPLFSQSYRIRFYREYFSGDNLSSPEFQSLVRRIVDLSVELARAEEPKIIRSVLRREESYFWFRARGFRIYLRKPLYQNSVLELLAKLEGSSEDRMKVRIKCVGAPAVELLARRCPGSEGREPGGSRPAWWAFVASAVMDHHRVPHYRIMAGIERPGHGEGWILSLQPDRGEYNLAEYLARRVAEEFSGLPWDRKFLVRVARFLQSLHDLGWYFPAPSGEDIWVRYTEAGTHELRLFNLARIAKLRPENAELRMKNVLSLWKVLPVSQADGLMIAEEYTRFCRAMAADRKRWLNRFREWQVRDVEPWEA